MLRLLLFAVLLGAAALSVPALSTNVRSARPQMPRRHILVAIPLATATHIAGPVEYCKELAERGHRISWLGLAENTHWFGSEQERAALPFDFVGNLSVPRLNEKLSAMMPKIIEADFITIIDEFFRVIALEPLYQQLYDNIQRIIRDDRPDVIVCDFFAIACVDIAEQFDIPLVVTMPSGLGDLGFQDAFDTPKTITGFSQDWHTQPMAARLYNTFLIIPKLIYYTFGVMDRLNAIRRRNGVEATVKLDDKWYGHDVILAADIAIEHNRYLPPYVHHVGPILSANFNSRLAPDNIDSELRQWLDESARQSRHVVYMAMGSLGVLTDNMLMQFATAFAQCPATPIHSTSPDASRFRVVWVNRQSLPAAVQALLTRDVRIERWVAQQAVLAHRSVKVFVTHGGGGSVAESVAVGLPMLAFPLFGDQPGNAAKLVDKGIALAVDKANLSADNVCASLRRLTFDDQILKSICDMQLISRFNGNGTRRGADIIERATISVKHLIPYRENSKVSWIIRYNVDVFALGLLILLLILSIIVFVSRFIIITAMSVCAGPHVKSKLN